MIAPSNKYLLYFYKIKATLIRRYRQGFCSDFDSYLLEKWLLLSKRLDEDLPEGRVKTYIRRSIYGYARNYFRDQARTVKVPRHYQCYAQAIQKLEQNAALDVEQICDQLGITKRVYWESLQAYNTCTVPLDEVGDTIQADFSEELCIVRGLSDDDKMQLEQLYDNVPLADILPNLSEHGKASLQLLLQPS